MAAKHLLIFLAAAVVDVVVVFEFACFMLHCCYDSKIRLAEYAQNSTSHPSEKWKYRFADGKRDEKENFDLSCSFLMKNIKGNI